MRGGGREEREEGGEGERRGREGHLISECSIVVEFIE